MNQPRKILFKVEKTENESFSIINQENRDTVEPQNILSCRKDAKKKEKKNRQKYACVLCNKDYYSQLKFDAHQQKHFKFQCNICKEICLNKPQLACHMRKNHMISCNECIKIFSTQDEFNQHLGIHFVKNFLIGFIKFIYHTHTIFNKLSRRAMFSSADRIKKKKQLMLIKRSKLLHKNQEIKEFNRCEDSTDNDE